MCSHVVCGAADGCTAAMQADSGWESAVACLKTVLGNAWEVMTSARDMLAVKDFMLLVCAALGAPSALARFLGYRVLGACPRAQCALGLCADLNSPNIIALLGLWRPIPIGLRMHHLAEKMHVCVMQEVADIMSCLSRRRWSTRGQGTRTCCAAWWRPRWVSR